MLERLGHDELDKRFNQIMVNLAGDDIGRWNILLWLVSREAREKDETLSYIELVERTTREFARYYTLAPEEARSVVNQWESNEVETHGEA